MVKLMTRRSGALSYRLLATSLAYNDLEDDPNVARAKAIAFLPIVHGGLGLRSSELIAPAAHWAAWADILPTIASRRPAWIETVLTELERTARAGIASRRHRRFQPLLRKHTSASNRNGAASSQANDRRHPRRTWPTTLAFGRTAGNSTLPLLL